MPEIKDELPYGSLPTLSIDEEIYSYSSSILRFVGKQAGLYPDEELASLRVDEVIDTILDFFHGLESLDKDAESYFEDVKKYLINSVPRYLGGLDSRLKQFGEGPWAVGDKISIADLAIYVCVLYIKAGAFELLTPEEVVEYERLRNCAEAVREHPRVIEWNECVAKKAAELKRKHSDMQDTR